MSSTQDLFTDLELTWGLGSIHIVAFGNANYL